MVLYALLGDRLSTYRTDFAKLLSIFDRSAIKNIIAPYMIINGKLEKNNAFSKLKAFKKRIKSMLPSTIEIIVKIKAIMPFASKLKAKPFSVALMPEIIDPPSTSDGMVTRINNPNNILVLVFMVIFFANN